MHNIYTIIYKKIRKERREGKKEQMYKPVLDLGNPTLSILLWL